MANVLFDAFKKRLLGIDALSGVTLPDFGGTGISTFRASLIDSGTFTPLPQTHNTWSQLSGVVDSEDIVSPAVTFSAGTATFDAADTVFSAVTGATVEDLVVDCHAASAATSLLIVFWDTGVSVTPNGGDITIAWAATGIFTW